ncbi:MAG: hypothetical protein ACXWWR_06545 [Candidatus Limnocylindrales bacterium]
MDNGTTARYRIHGVDVVVRSNDDAVLARVRDTYGWFEVDADMTVEHGATTVEVALIRAADGTTIVTDADGRMNHRREEDQPLVGLFDAIVAGSIAALSASGILAIHSGVVAMDGRAILVAGRSGRGKTTLVLGLLRRGLDLLSDELALVAPDDCTALAYPRGLHIRPNALDLFPELGFLTDVPAYELGGGSEWSVGPEDLERAFGTSVVAAARIGAVVLLDGDPSVDAAPDLRAVPGAIATMELLRGTPSAAWDFGGALARLPRIVADVPAVRLRSGRLDETVDAVLGWATGRAGSER